MNIGIILYSQTGNTLSVAQRLEAAFKVEGYQAEIARVEADIADPKNPAQVKLTAAPDTGWYDAVIFASPVHAFSLAPAMKLYLSQMQSLAGKTACCFVTQQFKKAWLGGNHSVRQFIKACHAKGTDICESGVVNWSSPLRENQIADIVNRFTSAVIKQNGV